VQGLRAHNKNPRHKSFQAPGPPRRRGLLLSLLIKPAILLVSLIQADLFNFSFDFAEISV
jgi:hypothetical protein